MDEVFIYFLLPVYSWPKGKMLLSYLPWLAASRWRVVIVDPLHLLLVLATVFNVINWSMSCYVLAVDNLVVQQQLVHLEL
eukprot:g10508.t1